jgi:carboxymethylenebutenolidase
MGQTIEIDAPGGPAEAYLAGEPGRPGVLLFMDAIGLRPRIPEMADRIASWGYVVLAPHVFYRQGRAADLAPREDLREPAAMDRFFADGVMERVGGYTPEQSDPDTAAWLDTLLEHARGPVGVTGYCMGARLAVRSAAVRPDLIAAVGGFHAGGLVTDGPDSPHRTIPGARAEFVLGHADGDRAMPAEAIAELGRTLDAAGLTHTNEVYAGAAHGYTMADTWRYDEAATDRHFAALQGLLGGRLG